MICRDAEGLIHGYLDRELDLSRSLEIEGHLKDCPACSNEYEQHLSLRSAIQNGSLYFEAPVDLRRSVRSLLHREHRNERHPIGLLRRWQYLWVPLGAVALVLLFTLPFVMRPSAENLLAQQILPAHVRSLMPGHLTDVPSSDQHTVKPWFNGRLDFSPPVTDLAAEGFPLIGGRLDYVGNRSVAAVVYHRRKHVINLFIWPSTGSGSETEKSLSQHGYNMVTWTQSGMTFWAVSDVGPADLHEFVRLIRR